MIPLEHQINEGQYIGQIGRDWTHRNFEAWVLEHDQSDKAKHVLAMVDEMMRPPDA